MNRAGWNMLLGRFQLRVTLEIAREELSGADETTLLNRARQFARSGQVTIYGEHGGARNLVPIPATYFETHALAWFIPTGTLSTIDPTKPVGNQDTDDCYYNLYVDKSLLRMVKERKTADI